MKDLWEYNPDFNSWLTKSSIGGAGRKKVTSFSIRNTGYLVTGQVNYPGSSNETWGWNQSTNQWSLKTNFPGVKRDFAVGFTINEIGYVGTGAQDTQGQGGDTFKDFFSFTPVVGLNNGYWTQKADFGGGEVTKAVGFAIGNKGYIGTGINIDQNTSYLRKDFWEYDSITNKWTRKADFGGDERYHAVGFAIGKKGYIGTGRVWADQPNQKWVKDFWEYDPMTNKWTQKADVGGKERLGAFSFSLNGLGYVGGGQGLEGQSNNYNDFWEYCPD